MWPQQPPYYGPQFGGTPCQYVPVPNDQVDNALKLLRKLEKRQERKKSEEENKKKEGGNKPSSKFKSQIPLPQVILMLIVSGIPVGIFEIWILEALKETLKQMLK